MMYKTTKSALVILFYISLSFGIIKSMTCAFFETMKHTLLWIDFKKLSSVAYVNCMVEPGSFKIGSQKHIGNKKKRAAHSVMIKCVVNPCTPWCK